MRAAVSRLLASLDTAAGRWIQRLIAAWCGLGIVLVLTQPGSFWTLSFGQHLSWPLILGALLFLSLLPALADRIAPHAHLTTWYLLILAGALPFVLAAHYGGGEPLRMAVPLIAFFLLLLGFAMSCPFLFDRFPLPRSLSVTAVAVLGVALFGVMGLHAVLRYSCFQTPNYDGGIFMQMFHYMRTTGLPLTTCERDGLLSHFAVHLSPIFYLLLPVYMLTGGHPLTLGLCQAAILASGLIPLYLLCRDKRLSEKLTVLIALAYCAYPAILSGTFYDLHENCFLTPLLLWLFWCGETDRLPGLIVSALLVLCVKEDAAVYVALYALYVMLGQKKWGRGALLLFGAVVWFFTAIWFINTYGEGAMLGRYSNLMYGEKGILPMLKTLLINPGLALRQLLWDKTDSNGKLEYLMQMLLGVGLLPFLSKKSARLVLAAPILLNLLTDYLYQHHIGFQYHFGITAFFFYAAVLNLKELPRPSRRFFAAFAAGAGVLMLILSPLATVSSNVRHWKSQRGTYTHMEQVLREIPEDASVTASAFLLAHLADRDILYEDFYHKEPSTAFLVLDIRGGVSDSDATLRDTYLAAGYTVWAEHPGELLILHTDTPKE